MLLKDLKKTLNEFDENQEIFICYSDNGETLTIVDIDRESGVCSDFPTLFLYAEEFHKFNKKIEAQIVEGKAKAMELHFGISKKAIKLPTEDDYNDEFEITFKALDCGAKAIAPNAPEPNYHIIEVVTKEVALSNEADFLSADDNMQNYVTENTIGGYTKLLNSEFYFRWL